MENSDFVFVCDHGEMLMDHNLGSKSARHYDAVIPLIVAGPGLQQGSTCDDFVQHEDISSDHIGYARNPRRDSTRGPCRGAESAMAIRCRPAAP